MIYKVVNLKFFVNSLLFLSIVTLLSLFWLSIYCGYEFEVFLSPLAILSSGLIAIRVAIMNIDTAHKLNQKNRTIEFLTQENPILNATDSSLSTAEQKLVMGNEKVIVSKDCNNKVELDLEELDRLLGSLTEKEKLALMKAASFFEILITNLETDYFSKDIVEKHLGKYYGVYFWVRAWPFILNAQHLSKLYADIKGIPQAENSGTFYMFHSYILSLNVIQNPYPLKGQSLAKDSVY